MKKIFTGKNPEENFGKLEKILPRIINKLSKKVVGVISPVPICFSGFSDPNCDIMSILFPASGIIRSASLVLENKPNATTVEIIIMTKLHTTTEEIKISGVSSFINPNKHVDQGDILTVRLNSVTEENYGKIWMSLLWIPDISQAELKEQLITNLEEII